MENESTLLSMMLHDIDALILSKGCQASAGDSDDITGNVRATDMLKIAIYDASTHYPEELSGTTTFASQNLKKSKTGQTPHVYTNDVYCPICHFQ